jgi:hypothetical protein
MRGLDPRIHHLKIKKRRWIAEASPAMMKAEKVAESGRLGKICA